MKNNKKNGAKKTHGRKEPAAAGRAKKSLTGRGPKKLSRKTRGSGDTKGRAAAEQPAITEHTVFHEIISAIGDGISIQNIDFMVLYQNAVHKQMTGDHTGEYCYRAYGKCETVCSGCPLERTFRDGKAHTTERGCETARGPVQMEITTSPLRDSSGKIVAGIEVVRDITDRKQAQEETRKTNALLQSLLQSIPDVIYLKDRDGRYQFVNRFYEELFHMRSGQILGKTLEDILPPGLAEKAAASDRMIWDNGKTVQEEQVFRSGGSTLFFDTIKTPMLDEQGNILGLLGVSRDITGRKKMEEALRESEERYHDLFENASDPIFILDAGQRYVDINRKAVEVFGYSKEEFRKMKVFDLVPPEQRERSEQAFKLLAQQGGYERFEGRVRAKDGRWLDVEVSSSSIVKDGKIVGSRDIVRDVTGRRRAEEALEVSRERLAQAQAMAHIGNWEWDTVTNEVFWSDEVYRIYGYEPREVRPDYDLVLEAMHPDTKQLFLAAIDAALKGEKPFEMDYVFVTKNGEKKTLHTIGRVFRDVGGKPVRMVGTVQDITERKRTEEALQESEERFRMLFENAPDAEFLADIETGTIIDANPTACHLLLMDRERIVGMHQTQLHPPRLKDISKDHFKNHVEQTQRGDRTNPLEVAVLRSDGEEIPVEVLAQKIILRGKPVLYGIFRDISSRKRAEAFINNILETVDEGFIIIDRDYRILSANRAYAQQAGRSVDEILGKKCHKISHGFTKPCHEFGETCAVRQVFETGEPHTALHTHQHEKNEPIYVETKAFPMRDAAGRVTAAIEIVNNITEQKKLEDQLRHAQKMEAVGLLAGGIAHDFNNILTAIIGYGNLLEMRYPEDDPHRQYVDQILAAAARAANLTQSLLAFSRKQVINPRPLDLNDSIARVEKLLQRVIGEDVDLRTDLMPGALIVMADSGQMEQVLMNLATNARDAMPGGGVLTIRTGTTTIDQEFRKEHGFGADGIYAMVAVSDTGSGMDEQTRARIFEPFFTTKELGRGTGLGLAIVYGAMKQNKGYVTVESDPGKGACFTLYFPRIETPAAGELTQRTIGTGQRGTGVILLAEDDTALRNLLRMMLMEFGYTVIEAVDGEDAVAKFAQHSGRVDLLVLDVIMPRKNGKEAYEAIKQVQPGIRTLFISGYNDDVMTRKVLVDDGCRYLAKPITPASLLDTVKELLAPRVP